MAKKLIVNGNPNSFATTAPDFETFGNFELDQSIQVSSNRSIASRQELVIENDSDIVEIQFEDKTTWIGNATEFQEIFNLTGKRDLEEDGFEVPAVLQSTSDRNVVQDLAINIFSLFKRKKEAIVDNAVHEIAKRIEDKVQTQPGLFLLDNTMRKKVTGKFTEVNKPYLLFIHGTNSNTDGAFGALLDNREFGLWDFITSTYGENILTFDHKTFTQSPFQNVLELLQQLPEKCTLHLITHSRGGLVGDIVARCHATNTTIGFSDIEIELFADEDTKKCMTDINELAKKKNLLIEKYIRVASPSMGTSLLADRLDHYLNTMLNFIGISAGIIANPIYAGIKALVAEVAATKSKVDVLPGIEVMMPDSPFIKMLNNPVNIIEAPLTIISGNCTIQLELKALLVILTKLYFRRKNDMVVDTWSMYFGTPRKKESWFFLDDAKGTDHIHYFRSKDSQEAIKRALSATGDAIAGFKTLQEADISDANRNAALAFVTAEVKMDMAAITGKKPIAIILPGIMGSNLYCDDDKIWVDFMNFIKGNLLKLDITAPNINAPSLMGSGYRKLAKYLSNKYDVLAFPFDWRKSLTEEAKKLDSTIKILLIKKQPIHVIAHSMGGVLFREFILLKDSQWPALNNSTGFKTLMLGAPLGGSYLIPETLSGRGGNISKLSLLDLKHGKKELLQVFSQCPGLYSLLPLSTTPYDFSKVKTWQDLFSNSQNIGTLPGNEILKGFVDFRDNILNNKGNIDYKNIIYVAGKSDSTTATYEIVNNGRDNGVVFKSTTEGDGSVTWASGIPEEMIQRNAVYYCNTEHGELANEPDIFNAFIELLETGTTALLGKTPPISRGGSILTDNPKYEIESVNAGNIEKVALGIKKTEKEITTDSPLKITMSNGNLANAEFPLLVGHFFKDGIMSAEKVLDNCFNGMLREKHSLGLYPGGIGSSEIFLSYNTSPKGVIIVGLGESGELNGYQLEISITQSVCKYLLELRDFESLNKEAFNNIFQQGIGITALIIGTGYGGLSMESSIKAIIMAVKKANSSIKSLNNASLKIIETIELVELYEERSLQAFYILKKLEADQHLNIVLPFNKIKKLPGIRKRVPLDYQQDWWQRISVSVETSPTYYLKFSASTGSAREEVRNLNSNPVIIQHFIDEISGNNRWTTQLAKTIFELLVPNDFKDAVRNQYNILWKLDKNAAAFPWEMLQDNTTQSKPLCVNAGMIRQLATSDYRTQIKRSYNNNALVIGDPDLEGFVHQLPGAVMEAKKVSAIIADNDYTVVTKINKKFAENIQAVFQEEYKLIHLAGHGYFKPEDENDKQGKKDTPFITENSGMVIGNGIFLTTKEINQMSQVPEFVFVNCCFLGKVDSSTEEYFRLHYKLAANLGVQLIEMGVKAVIAAGWAVDDNAALLFSETFYKEMFAGATFSDAVLKGRSECFEKYPDNNTWGAYQCYGDQFYKFITIASSKTKTYSYVLPMEVEVDLNNLFNRINDGRHETDSLLQELQSISNAVDKCGVRNGAITEMEARILIALNKQDSAIAKINDLLKFEEADYTVNTLENLYNLNIKVSKNSAEKTAADVQTIIDNFSYLLKIGDTCQRHLLLGMAYKILFIKSDTEAEKMSALKNAANEYKQAYDIAKKNDNGVIDPLCNWLQLESMLVLADKEGKAVWGANSVNKYKLPTVKLAAAWLDKMLQADIDREKDYEFWDSLNDANVLLTKLCLLPDSIKAADIVTVIKKYWIKTSAKIKLANGLEYLQLLTTAAKLSTQPKAKILVKTLDNLNELLRKEDE